MMRIIRESDGGRYVPSGHSETVVSRSIYDDSLDVHQTTFPVGSSMAEEVHENRTHVFYVLEGLMQVLQGGNELGVLGTGDSVVIPAGECHEIANAGDGEMSFLAMTFPISEHCGR